MTINETHRMTICEANGAGNTKIYKMKGIFKNRISVSMEKYDLKQPIANNS